MAFRHMRQNPKHAPEAEGIGKSLPAKAQPATKVADLPTGNSGNPAFLSVALDDSDEQEERRMQRSF
jgi:hypothetical protein